jgi:exodeoxyribonuclease-3
VVKLVTWNVNSLGVRLPRVLEFLETVAPDVACLQETKCKPDAFPAQALRDAGYEAVHHSGGQWAGVAILARAGLELRDASSGLPGEVRADQARWIEATVDGVRVASTYVVNGQAIGTETFAEKLTFLEAIATRVGRLRQEGTPMAVAGDFNVCPTDLDVYDPSAFVGSTHVTEDERSRLQAILAAGGLQDAHEVLHHGEQRFTWWDYRQGHFHRGLGLRIDLVLLSDALAATLGHCAIERDFRKGTKPSDHAPLLVSW